MFHTLSEQAAQALAIIAIGISGAAYPAFAQSPSQSGVADFFKGKTISVSVGGTPGGGYDLDARVLAGIDERQQALRLRTTRWHCHGGDPARPTHRAMAQSEGRAI